LAIHDGVATLFAASTLRPFRGRGVQTALLRARLSRGIEAGAELALCVATPGSTSQRNILRHGFQTMYTRVKFEKDLDLDDSRRRSGTAVPCPYDASG